MNLKNEIKCEGVVIYKEDYAEADVRIIVLTDKLGVLNFYINGVRKTKKRDIAAIDILSYSKFDILLKNEKYSLKDFELVENFMNIKSDLLKISSALYISDTIKKIFLEGEEREKEFKLLLDTFYYFEKEDCHEKILLAVAFFLFKIIEREGIYFEKINDIISVEDKKKLEEVKILESFIEKKVKLILKEKLEEKSLLNVIEVLEKYINEQLDTRLNFKKIIIL